MTKLPLVLFGFLVGGFIAEVALRLAGYSFPEFYQIDQSRGYGLRPTMEGWYRKEGGAYVHINGDGLRDREHDKVKSAGTFRIAVLGDSYAEALQVAQEQAFWSVMESELQKCTALVSPERLVGVPLRGHPVGSEGAGSERRGGHGGPPLQYSGAAKTEVGVPLRGHPVGSEGAGSERRGGGHGGPPSQYSGAAKIEVINFGVSGYSTAQQLITLRDRVWSYSPDLILLTVTTNNDISDNSRALKKTDEIPYFIYRNNQLILDDSFKQSAGFRLRQSFISRTGRWLKDHSRVVQAVIEGHRGFKVLLASFKWRLKTSQSSSGGQTRSADSVVRSEELGVDNLVYREPTSSVWMEAWSITESLIREMRDEVRSHGASFVVITLSNPPQVVPDAKARQMFMERVGVSELFYPDNRIRLFAEREGIPIITLAPELQAYAEEEKVFLHGFGAEIGNGHWNAEGHRVAGEIIARKLCQNNEVNLVTR